jgi:hypothetical protein
MSSDPIVGGDADAVAADIAAGMESGKVTTAKDEVSPPEAGGLIGHSQDVRKGATLYSDFSFKDDPSHQSNNINLHSLRFDDYHSF